MRSEDDRPRADQTRWKKRRLAGTPLRRRLSRPAALLLVGLDWSPSPSACVWRTPGDETARRKMFLPQLEAQARRSPYDGPLLALLGGGSPRRTTRGVPRMRSVDSLAAGERSELIYQTLAASLAAVGRAPAPSPIYAWADLPARRRRPPSTPPRPRSGAGAEPGPPRGRPGHLPRRSHAAGRLLTRGAVS